MYNTDTINDDGMWRSGRLLSLSWAMGLKYIAWTDFDVQQVLIDHLINECDIYSVFSWVI